MKSTTTRSLKPSPALGTTPRFNGWSKTALLIVAPILLCASVSAQVTGPTDNKGVTSKALNQLELKDEIDGMEGRALRARQVTIEPGGHTAAHSHLGRPTLEYIQQGNVIEIRNGVEIPHSAGEMVPSRRDVTHHWENRGTVPVVLIPIDIYKQ